MKRFGVSNYQLQNVKQNFTSILLSSKKMFNERREQVKSQVKKKVKEQFNRSIGSELEQLITKANEALLSVNHWLKEQEEELSVGEKNVDTSTETVETKKSATKPVLNTTTIEKPIEKPLH